MSKRQVIQVVVASPTDVRAERELVENVARELNHSVGDIYNLVFHVRRWETDSHPGWHPKGAQGIIDDTLGIDDCDLLIGIFWKRFGTPVMNARSGTEHEFMLACEIHKRTGSPEIMMYFRQQTDQPKDEQAKLVTQFKKELPKEVFYWDYKDLADFEWSLRVHLVHFLYRNAASRASQAGILHQLPPTPSDFMGREQEIDEIVQQIERGDNAIGLVGIGGVGKSTLAIKVADEIKQRYPTAQIFFDLRGASVEPATPMEAMAHVIRSFRRESKIPETENELIGLYRSTLYGQRAILLMDNARDAAQVEPLCPPLGSTLLTTSRWRFAFPGFHATDVAKFSPANARAFLIRNCPRIEPVADEIAHCCGCLPVALRRAANTLTVRREISPSDYLQKLSRIGGRLSLIEPTIQVSYALLDTHTQRRWRTLTVFPETFEANGAAAVWATEPQQASETLSKLLAGSLLEFDARNARYALDDLAREFAAYKSENTESGRQEAEKNHAIYYKNVLAEANRLYRQGGVALQRGLALFDIEAVNIRAGQAWAARHTDHEKELIRLSSSYAEDAGLLLALRLKSSERIHWLRVAIKCARSLKDDKAESKHLGNLGNAYAALGQTHRAIDRFNKALAIENKIHDRQGIGNSIGNLGNAYMRLGKTRHALQSYRKALAIHRRIPDVRGVSISLGHLGDAYLKLGSIGLAIRYYKKQLKTTREIGYRRGESNAFGGLGLAYGALLDNQASIDSLAQQLEITRQIGYRRGEANALYYTGLALERLDRQGEAILYAETALRTYEEIGDPDASKVRKQLEKWKTP